MLQNANASLSPTVHYFADPSMFREKTSHLHLLVRSVGENPYPYHLVAHILKIQQPHVKFFLTKIINMIIITCDTNTLKHDWQNCLWCHDSMSCMLAHYQLTQFHITICIKLPHQTYRSVPHYYQHAISILFV